MKVKLNNVRIAFPDLFEPKSFNDSAPRYSATFLFEPDSAAHEKLVQVMEQVGEEKWKKEWAKVKKQLESQDKTCLHDGGLKDYDGYEGNLFVSAGNKVRPTVIDTNKSPLAEADGKIYGGCYVNAVIDIWAQDNQFGKRINASLKGVQFCRDGEPFGSSGGDCTDDFDEIDEDFDDLL